jgi:PKD repeat protein
MSAPAQAPQAAPAPAPAPAKSGGWLKAGLLGIVGLGGGIAGTYAMAVVDRVVKPPKPVANFAVSADGLTVTCQNHASGESGWWDFGDGTPLEPFAADQPASHQYAKPGSYSVKLIVRNFLGDENERTVPIDLGPPKDAPAPKIGVFVVQPVSAAPVAPATFRLTADVTNASSCVWDFGDGRVEVSEGGKIDRLVTFEKPGQFAISLVAHNGKLGAKESTPVKVDAPRDGTTMAVLRVTDSGTKTDRLQTTEAVAVPVPTDKGATTFTKTVTARAGFTLTEAALADAPKSVKNVKVSVSADKRSATVQGEWAGDLKATNKAAGGSDALVRVKLTQERVIAQPPAVTMVTSSFAAAGQMLRADLPLPPAVAPGAKREYQLEVRTVREGKVQTILTAPLAKLPWQTAQQGPGWTVTYSAQQLGETVVVTAQQTK